MRSVLGVLLLFIICGCDVKSTNEFGESSEVVESSKSSVLDETRQLESRTATKQRLLEQFHADLQQIFSDTPIVKYETRLGMLEHGGDRIATGAGYISSNLQRIQVIANYFEVDGKFVLSGIWGEASGKPFIKVFNQELVDRHDKIMRELEDEGTFKTDLK